MSDIQSPVTDLLDEKNIDYTVIDIPMSEDKKPIRDLEQWLRDEGRDPNSVVRSLLFKTGSDKFALLAVAGGGRADWAILRAQLGEKKLRMAEFDEVSAATGYVVGAVPPIALPENIVVLVDNSVNQYHDVIIGSGMLGYALALTASDLLSLLATAPMATFTQS
ncbi:YbaK/prolyl-tRNA synthetase associated region [Methylophaga frappieri]|uniref:YbaK/prolyl-tRNA synthetase associated region n=1 Tax=Methylophaga frappieri (strain ATCC BAA-2434 / DSM 25690 / JAM7) TaxID=754477 RepID=I1YFX8_METFJ|nr:YbaK/EbsC family protein [Methylophaga frappieri]AFJ01821.1 YbaK/prolyl-tRNA synthetase associated region [Methylophaga frappieri]